MRTGGILFVAHGHNQIITKITTDEANNRLITGRVGGMAQNRTIAHDHRWGHERTQAACDGILGRRPSVLNLAWG
jgi:hypothetical protein